VRAVPNTRRAQRARLPTENFSEFLLDQVATVLMKRFSTSGKTVAVAAANKQRSAKPRTIPRLNGRGYTIF
jgi:hypothetical protein